MPNDFDFTDPFAVQGLKNRHEVHSSPYYTYHQLYAPRRLKELFRWCEYLFFNSPQIYAALRKFGEYPITDFVYETTNESLKHKHKNLLENVIRARELLIQMTLDKYVYGNGFITMYQPFIRYLKCPKCGILTNIENISYEYSYRRVQFVYTCPECGKKVVADEEYIEDRKLPVSRKINFIRWDPKLMDIDHNPITNSSVYYYRIPPDVEMRVQHGHKTLIDTLPLEILKTVRDNQQFRFAPNAIFHMKVGGPAGVNPHWGLPPVISSLQLFHFTAILRKANEAIALDYLTPFRIVHPAQASGNADPVSTISLEKWKDNLKDSFRQWRRDPLHLMFAPIPVGMTQLGGNGRALLTLGEIQEAERSIIASLGIPQEFLYGGLTRSGMEATLRLIENQLETHINDLKDLLQWISDSCAKFLGWQKIKVDMTPFKLTDDFTQKQFILQLYMQGQQSGRQIISDSTVARLNGIDIDKEEDLIKQEALASVRRQQELTNEINKIQSNAAQQSQAAAQQGTTYNQQQIIAQADQIVQQLLYMDNSLRKSNLEALKVEDFVLYSVVIQRLETQQSTLQGQQSMAGGV